MSDSTPAVIDEVIANKQDPGPDSYEAEEELGTGYVSRLCMEELTTTHKESGYPKFVETEVFRQDRKQTHDGLITGPDVVLWWEWIGHQCVLP